ncbi:c6 zinc finger domain containing protein [Grosmannia clavigera kw1407]|uniref:C6 zinc finger domain containing protein n=1 Tax=Grosmannia clavigera (strain kw1407 / UAMH 11150) TaxID=655863 RepID=F0XUW2_GROCL|nr:c6 zinc finger domain containing protein [Grosmannia clavigera kw1407]EFW98481.1 c6 zinc finger domain containing protein [Grosmannia clavigera kw1407]
MQTLTSTYHLRLAEPQTSLGRRRDCLDLARFSLDLTWARAESERAARAKAYPSPPMSGSPPLPSKPTHEAGGWSQGRQQSTSHDAYRGSALTTASIADVHRPAIIQQPQQQQQQQQQHRSSVDSYAHPHPHSHAQQHQYQQQQPPPPPTQTPLSYPRPYSLYSRSEDPSDPRSMSSSAYASPQLLDPAMPAHLPYLPPLPGPGPMQQGYPISVPSRPPPPSQVPSPNSVSAPGPSGREDSIQPFDSPKSQRKTKGHVASACVPCKRAHLRCDSQRPCSRCLSNNKEDACVDVQHKKRGRPRLREERDLRYDLSGRGGPGGHPAESALHRPQILYGQSPSSMGTGFIERGGLAEANVYSAPPSISTMHPVPAAYLTMNLGITKASSSFSDAVGHQNTIGLNLRDLTLPADDRSLQTLLHQMHDERRRKDPQYLPPIFPEREQDRVIQALGFSSDDMARFSLDRPEYITFRSQDGQQRGFRAQFGLAKQDSIYFIVLLLHVEMRSFGHPTPSPQSREVPYAYPPLQHPPQHQAFSHSTPVAATFDVTRSRLATDLGSGPALHPPPPSGPVMAVLSPALPSTYSAFSSRSEYLAGPSSYQTPRSAPGLVAQPHQQQPPSSYQLPPIRSRHEARPLEFLPTTRDDKTRVDIGGLIDKPEPLDRRPSR